MLNATQKRPPIQVKGQYYIDKVMDDDVSEWHLNVLVHENTYRMTQLVIQIRKIVWIGRK